MTMTVSAALRTDVPGDSLMDGAALLVLIASAGVGFGWQPMPDGSPRYEYIVQLDPELAATLADGKPIPIVGEVPDEVQPVGRIRLVVGSETLPRQRLVTRLKPADPPTVAAPGSSAGPPSQGDVELAQYDSSGNNRYGAPAAPGAESQWNGDEAAVDAGARQLPGAAAPTSQQLFESPPAAGQSPGGTAAWNDAANQAAGALAAPIARAGDKLQRAAEPLRDGLNQVDERVQAAADKFGSRTRRFLEEFDRPLGQPPASEAVAEDGTWNQDDVNNPQSAETNAPSDPNRELAAPSLGQSDSSWNGEAVDAPAAQSATDQWAGVPDPRAHADVRAPSDRASPPAEIPGVASRPNAPYAGAGSTSTPTGHEFPNLGNPGLAPPVGNNATSPSIGDPSIARDMLREPPGRPLDGEATSPATGGLATANPSTQSPASTWPTGTNGAASLPAATQSAANGPPSGGRDNAALVIAAWVLLSGSVAGNLYLFWSYLDVRQKYRALVRKTARAVGSRFSAA